MDKIHWRLADRFRTHWIKVKFYKEKPNLKDVRTLKDVRFCEAAKKAVLGPIILDRESISCPGAIYAFGWDHNMKNELLKKCQGKSQAEKQRLESMLNDIDCFKNSFKYVGLNTEGEPDIILSYLLPQEIMGLITIYNNYTGKKLDISLCSMMSICGGIAARTYLTQEINLSFGCNDSRKYADIGRGRLAIGIPNKLFKIFDK